MSNFFISSSALAGSARTAVSKLQLDLARAQKEIATGKLADAGLSLGTHTSEGVVLRQAQAWHEAIVHANANVAARLDTSQSALDGMEQTAQGFLNALLGARGSTAGRAEIAGQAKAALNSLVDQLNTQVGGVHVFAGDNGGETPLAGYYAPANAASRQGITAAFSSTFGMAQTDPAVSSISALSMTQFIDGAFANEFSDAAWTANWSMASTKNATARIAVDEKIEISANANEPVFRALSRAYVMVADLGGQNLNPDTLNAVLDKATKEVGTAMGGLASVRARLGTSQERVAAATSRLEIGNTIIANRLSKTEAVDPYTAATTANQIMTQLQASYSVTARIQQLSLLNYL
jgi:flagellar hook-associated protein 3 FlgL